MNGVIFMTALVPTIGHKRLIEFALSYLQTRYGGSATLHVVVSSRSKEPYITADRVMSLASAFGYGYGYGRDVVFHDHEDNDAPQNCKTDEEWNYWVRIAKHVAGGEVTHLFGSDMYCKEFADRIGCSWVPVDPYREVLPVKGRDVREYLFEQQDKIIPEWIESVGHHVVLFGQESVGKTTLSKMLAEYYWTKPVHEWARPYLECVGADLTYEKMSHITYGQIANETTAPLKLVNIYDTDILSTYGYYRLMGMQDKASFKRDEYGEKNINRDIELIRHRAKNYDLSKRIYLIPSPADVPFEADQLRYGNGERETSMRFWQDILDEFGIKYHVLRGSLEQRFRRALDLIESATGFEELARFEREEP